MDIEKELDNAINEFGKELNEAIEAFNGLESEALKMKARIEQLESEIYDYKKQIVELKAENKRLKEYRTDAELRAQACYDAIDSLKGALKHLADYINQD